MAYESGNFLTNQYSNRGLKFSWEISSQSIEKNSTTIYWKLEGAGSATKWYESGNFLVKIDGDKEYESATRIQLLNGTLVADGYKTITHNTDGSRSFSAYVEAGVYYYAVNCSGSGSWELKPIPRAASITDISTAIDDEINSITFTYKNPAGSAVDAIWFCIGDREWNVITPYEQISKSGNAFIYYLTDERKKLLRKAATNEEYPITYYFKTIIGGTEVWSNVFATLTIKNAKPVLNPTIADVGAVSAVLTGNPTSKLIKGYNSIEYAFNATAQKEASIVSYSLTCGGVKINDGTNKAYNVESGDFVFTVTDSRGLTATKTFNFDVVPYIKPSISQALEMALVGETGAKVTITLKGNYYKGSFGAVNNSLTLKYRKKEDSGSYGSWVTVSATPSFGTNNYSLTFDVTGLSYSKTYTFQCSAADATGDANKAQTAEYVINLIPVFDWGKDDFAFNVPVSIQGNMIADFVVEQGTSGNWKYTKWRSGKVELFGAFQATTTIAEQKGSLYRSGAITASLPFTVYSGRYWLDTTDGNIWATNARNSENIDSVRFTLFSPWLTSASGTYIIDCKVEGNWK